MDSVRQQARDDQRIEALCSAAVRAFTGDPGLHLRAGALFRRDRRVALHAHHLRLEPSGMLLSSGRGAADGIALRLRLSDPQVHRAHCPGQPLQRLVFELLEQLRVESLVPDRLPGMAANLRRRFRDWSYDYHHAGLTGTALGILLYTVAQLCWARLNGCAVLAQTEDLIEPTRAGIVPLIGHALAALKRERLDQSRYAGAALAIAQHVQGLFEAEQAARAGETADGDDAAVLALRRLLDGDDAEDTASLHVSGGRRRAFDRADIDYRVFTMAYDRELAAAGLVRAAQLTELRTRLDRLVASRRFNGARLARQLALLFARPVVDDWLSGEEEGRIDGRRLAQLVSSPGEQRVFRRERRRPRAQATVSFLIDCSGSMKAHIESVAVLVDVFVRALHLAGVDSEVLGFTTGAWHGGRAQRDWLARGRPAAPGRLAEVMHLVFKDADTRWRDARPSIAALLKPELFREGVDGEAVDWACRRLLDRDAGRRVLLVFSDGCPMDGATQLANGADYLDRHLKAVAASYQRQGQVEILGLGVGMDLGAYYRRRIALDLDNGPDQATVDTIVAMLEGRLGR